MHYAKASPDDLLMSIQVTNAGPEADTLHALPIAWFRDTWSWDAEATEAWPTLQASGDQSISIDHPFLGTLKLIAATTDKHVAKEINAESKDIDKAVREAASEVS